jgi:hypothetical protein
VSRRLLRTVSWREHEKQRAAAEKALAKARKALRKRRGVVGVGVGPRQKAGAWNHDDVCIQVFVVRKVPESAIPERMRLPKEIDGVPVDVIEARFTGFAPCPPAEAARRVLFPMVIGGIAIADPASNEFGTLGCVLRDPTATYLLTAQHVTGPAGTWIVQPFFSPDWVGVVQVAVFGTAANLDAALVQIGASSGRAVAPGVYPLPGTSLGTGDVRAAPEPFVVHGACNGSVQVSLVTYPWGGTVSYASGASMTFHDHVLVAPSGGVLGPGDSGAAVLDAEGQTLLGMLVAGTPTGTLGVVTPLPYILGNAAFKPHGVVLQPL